MRVRCCSTVPTAMKHSLAIWRLVRPSAASEATRSSMAVSMSVAGRSATRGRPPAADQESAARGAAATAETLDRLAAAQRSRSAVRVHYVAVDGRPAERELRSVRAAAGLVLGTDTDSAQQVSIPLSRVSFVDP